MSMKSIFFLIILCGYGFLFFSCQQNNQTQLQVLKIKVSENTSANLSDFIEKSEMIKLEMTDSCLISGIRSLELSQQFIFVNSGTSLFQFNRNGKFIQKIGRTGRGPHEYRSISSFTCSQENERIYIGTLGKILSFDFNGHFIEEIEEYKLFDYLKIYDGQLWAFFAEIGNSNQEQLLHQNKVYQYSLEGGILEDSLLLKTIAIDNQVAAYSPKMQYLSKYCDQLYLYCPVLIPDPVIRDTLYYMKDKQFTPALKLDFSDITITDGKKRNITISNIRRTQRYLFAEYKYQQRNRLFLFDFSENKQYNLTGGFNDNIYGSGEVSLRPLDLKSNQAYFTKNGFELEGVVEGISENSNPVVFILKLNN